MTAPCFSKLLTFMQAHDACVEAYNTVQAAKDWNELVAHPQAGGWSVWVCRIAYRQACEQARQAYEQARQAYEQAHEQARQACEQARRARKQARRARERAREQACEQARQACEQAWQAYGQACIAIVRKGFEPTGPVPDGK